jgi:hypothetical protein
MVIAGDFMTRNSGQHQIAMTLPPHLCIGAAYCTATNRQDGVTFFFLWRGAVIFQYQVAALSK